MDATTVNCGESLDLRVAGRRRAEWIMLLDGGTNITLDVGQLATVDTAGVQLLLATERECRNRKRPFALTGESAALARALAALGLPGWRPLA